MMRLLKLLGVVVFCLSGAVWAVDTDKDTLPDDWELAHGRNPNVADYAVAAGANHQCAIDDEGVKCWGSNSNGQLNVPVGLANPYAVTAGNSWSCACDDNGSTCWGTNAPASPTCSVTTSGSGTAVNAYAGWCGITGQSNLTCAISGNNVACDFNAPSVTLYYSTSYPVSCTNTITKTVTGFDNSVAVNAPVQVNQYNSRFCALGTDGVACYREQPIKWDANTGTAQQIYAMHWSLVTVGTPSRGIVIDSDGDGSPRPYDVNDLDDTVKDVLATVDGDHDTLPDSWELANGRNPAKPDYAVAVGTSHKCVIDEDGVKCWGANTSGQLDVPPILQTGSTHPYALTAGNTWSCACDDNGSTCWGSGYPAEPSCKVSKAGFSASVYSLSNFCGGGSDSGWSGAADLQCSLTTAGDAQCGLSGYANWISSRSANPAACTSVASGVVIGQNKTIPSSKAVQLDQNGKQVCTLGDKGFKCFDFTYVSDDAAYLAASIQITWNAADQVLPNESVMKIDSDGDGSVRPWDPDDLDPLVISTDDDLDGVSNDLDNCRYLTNSDQLDTDSDAQGNVCDADDDNDGVLDATDKFPVNVAVSIDTDNDGYANSWNAVCDAVCQASSGLVLDNCPSTSNPTQANFDGDAQGDICDVDDDNDAVLDVSDNCPLISNADQLDSDSDVLGDVCDAAPYIANAGSLDSSFNPGSGASSTVTSMVLQTDGKILIGGAFTSFNGTARNYIARLNADGSLDNSFNPGTGANSSIYAMAAQADGKILIGGVFTSFNGTARNYIARLNADGSLDSSFNPGTGANDYVRAVALQTDGRILIGGDFSSFNGAARSRIARLSADGSLDSSFNPGTGGNDVRAVVLQTDGRILIGGDFSNYNGTERNYIARLNADGSFDSSFNPGSRANNYVYAMALQADGKIFIGGAFTSFNGTARNYIARLNADGSLDNNFSPGTGANSSIYAMAAQADGKIFIGGAFTSFNGTARNRIARLNADGSLDNSFNPGTGANNYVLAVVLQTDGRILIGGSFSSFNGTARNNIARIHSGDTDSDGIQDAADKFPFDPTEWLDTDNDTLGNNADWDDDNDGVPDTVDAAPLDAGDTSEITLPLEGAYKGLRLEGSQQPSP